MSDQPVIGHAAFHPHTETKGARIGLELRSAHQSRIAELEREIAALKAEVKREYDRAGSNARAHNNVEDERFALYVALRDLYEHRYEIVPDNLWSAAAVALKR